MSEGQSSNNSFQIPPDENPYQVDLNGSSRSKRRRTNFSDNLNQWFHQQEGIGQEPGNSDSCSLCRNIYGSDYLDCSLTLGRSDPFTSLCLSLPEDQHNCHAGTASTGQEMASSFNDLWAEITRQEDEMNKLIRQQEEQQRKLLKFSKRQVTGLANKIKRLPEEKLIQKDLALEQLSEKNRELMEKFNRAVAEARHWKFQAFQSQATVSTLQAEVAEIERAWQEACKDDAASCVGGNEEGSMMTKCHVCKREEAIMLHLPCRHLSVCARCDQSIWACPVCFSAKTRSIFVIFP